jgi:putative tryptophan/tyrosine transport system substrate-binding protein
LIVFLIRRLLPCVVLLCAVGAGLCARPAAATGVTIVVSEDTGVYQEVAAAITARLSLGRSPASIRTLSAPAVVAHPELLADSSLLISVGLRAAQDLAQLESGVPLICSLIPKRAYEDVAGVRSAAVERRSTAVYFDQPIARQLDLIRAALPGHKRVGAVLGPISAASLGAFETAARERQLAFVHEQIADSAQLFAALERVVAHADVLLAVADPVVINATTAQNTLLTAYRHQVPVVAFSDSYVKAGALVAVFSTPTQQAAQVAEMAIEYLATGARLSAPAYPKYFTVRVNRQVARSLGVAIEEEATLVGRVSSLEGARR